ncbi:hypothetical protein HMI55_001431 [Coelomomyces lativittatus]|nr:hypothetical protein HMI55_001431 [Coelomomyces lativittatus]
MSQRQDQRPFRQGLTQGVSSFLALGLHELPHRLSDYMLLQQGASVTFAKRAQFFIALSTLLGSLGAQHLPSWIFHPLIPVAHGGFMYIATTMILPGLLHSPLSGWKGMLCFFLETAAMAGGIWVMQKLA